MQALIYKELLTIADNKKIEVLNSTFNSNMKGFYIYDKDLDVKVIFLNNNIDDPVERNFILGHELGHHELHHGKINEVLFLNDISYKNNLEDEANNYSRKLIDEIIGGLESGI